MNQPDTDSPHIYHRVIDPRGEDSLTKLSQAIRAGSIVLELGVATGYFSRFLKEKKGCIIDGVEIDPVMAREAIPFLRKLVIGDLDQLDIRREFGGGVYDFVICADVLEHLHHPEHLLKQTKQVLAPGGKLLISIPNMAYGGIIIALIQGDFPYRFEGLLDNTHLRFYTRKTFTQLLKSHDFHIESIETISLPLRRSEFAGHVAACDADWLNRIYALPDVETYQYVISASCSVDEKLPSPPKVDVIIPVYRDLVATRRCIESVLSPLQLTPYELIIIDDQSPEPELRGYLDDLAAQSSVTLVRNEQNLGFVASANRGMTLHDDRDVVLLNSDCVVNGHWLDRMHQAAQSAETVATVTPYTNNGTLCSYPRLLAPNELPDGWDLPSLDNLFASLNRCRYVEIPTAVGFCMYIRRASLARVGLFNITLFEKGYGEEVDWCMRAAAQGFQHLLCTDTFVYHQGGVSFGPGAESLKTRAQQIIDANYPGYAELIGQHIQRDPGRICRRRVDIERLRASPRPTLLMVMHAGGGGTEQHIGSLVGLLRNDFEVLILRPLPEQQIRVDWAQTGEEFNVFFSAPRDYPVLVSFLRSLGIARVHYHHLLGLGQQMLGLSRDLGLPYDFTVHDYYAICPQCHLTDQQGLYCGEPDTAGCDQCLKARPSPWGLDITSWRNLFEKFLSDAERVIVPSQDVARRLDRYFGLDNVRIWSHPEPVAVPIAGPYSPQKHNDIKVLVLGRLTPEKGLHVLEACAKDAVQRKLPLTFRLLGYATEPMHPSREFPLSISGEYQHSELADLIRLERADLIFFPHLLPETYSYTLSAAIQSDMPILASDLGAFPERLADYPLSKVCGWRTEPPEWNNEIMVFVHDLANRDNKG